VSPEATSSSEHDLVERARPIGASERILDLGCGTGVVARVLRERLGGGAAIVGIDASQPLIEVARSLEPELDFRVGTAAALPFADASFDLVLCHDIRKLEPDHPGALREVLRVLSPRGRLLAGWSLDDVGLGPMLAESGFTDIRIEKPSNDPTMRQFGTISMRKP
jgi:ubiquinone/menaquinone biosynthesis C-methylase UbiE